MQRNKLVNTFLLGSSLLSICCFNSTTNRIDIDKKERLISGDNLNINRGTKLQVSLTKPEIRIGESTKINVHLYDSGITNNVNIKDVKFSAEVPESVSIDENGNVTGLLFGTFKITITYQKYVNTVSLNIRSGASYALGGAYNPSENPSQMLNDCIDNSIEARYTPSKVYRVNGKFGTLVFDKIKKNHNSDAIYYQDCTKYHSYFHLKILTPCNFSMCVATYNNISGVKCNLIYENGDEVLEPAEYCSAQLNPGVYYIHAQCENDKDFSLLNNFALHYIIYERINDKNLVRNENNMYFTITDETRDKSDMLVLENPVVPFHANKEKRRKEDLFDEDFYLEGKASYNIRNKYGENGVKAPLRSSDYLNGYVSKTYYIYGKEMLLYVGNYINYLVEAISHLTLEDYVIAKQEKQKKICTTQFLIDGAFLVVDIILLCTGEDAFKIIFGNIVGGTEISMSCINFMQDYFAIIEANDLTNIAENNTEVKNKISELNNLYRIISDVNQNMGRNYGYNCVKLDINAIVHKNPMFYYDGIEEYINFTSVKKINLNDLLIDMTYDDYLCEKKLYKLNDDCIINV